jgi:hypothetical protein
MLYLKSNQHNLKARDTLQSWSYFPEEASTGGKLLHGIKD